MSVVSLIKLADADSSLIQKIYETFSEEYILQLLLSQAQHENYQILKEINRNKWKTKTSNLFKLVTYLSYWS